MGATYKKTIPIGGGAVVVLGGGGGTVEEEGGEGIVFLLYVSPT